MMQPDELRSIIVGWGSQEAVVKHDGKPVPVIRLQITLDSTCITRRDQMQPLEDAFERFLESHELDIESHSSGFGKDINDRYSKNAPRVIFTINVPQRVQIQEVLEYLTQKDEGAQ